jgi:hypothetical protein
MPEFDEVRQKLREAREQTKDAGDATFAARERVRRIEKERRALERAFDPQNGDHVERRKSLDDAHAQATADFNHSRDAKKNASAFEAGLVNAFELFSDPQEAIKRFDDDFPILMMPVRLETRFKTVANPQTGGQLRQLWVRIYPDDCSIDTFEETLSVREVENAQLYWSGIWEAGGHEDQQRGAWRGLVASHGSGRAEYVLAHYQPSNLPAPTKPDPADFILTIPTESPLDPLTEVPHVVTFWQTAWLADGHKTKLDLALAALVTALGQDRADEIITKYVPANFAQKPDKPLKKTEVGLSVAFVVFPKTEELELKQGSWARAPRAVLLPDRFVFIGYNTVNDANPTVVTGKPVVSPLIVAPDPSAPVEEQLKHDEHGELVFPEEMRWMVDFDRAVEVGIGLRINLNQTQAANGFERVLVVGLRSSDDHEEAREGLQTLIEHHRSSRTGFALLPQGTPTNNTEAASSGFVRGADADESFDDLLKGDLFAETANWLDKTDGQWLAEYLGIDSATLKRVRHSGGRDQADARAMNVTLWSSTLGYWFDSMMSPVFADEAVDQTRDFFNFFVTGRGAVPAFRIGHQPYGILPATALSRMQWMKAAGTAAPVGGHLNTLYQLLLLIDADWRALSGNVSFVGRDGDPHKLLLDIVGLHPGSVEFSSRYAESAEQLANHFSFGGIGGLIAAILRQTGIDLLSKFGYNGREAPDILNKFFYGRHELLKGPLVDDKPLSETEQIRFYTADNRNYLKWLIDASRTSLDALYRQEGFVNNKPPQALLYLMLRHSLQLGYHDVSIRLHREFDLLDAHGARLARRDDPFIHVRQQPQQIESRYELLYKVAPEITKSQTVELGDFIASSLKNLSVARYLSQQVDALERLKDASTARLERAFAEHIDCCSYRLDSWLLGLVHKQLARMRNLQNGSDAPARRGIYVGAYAWLEPLRPENKQLTPVQLTDPDLVEAFGGAKEPLTRDNTNQGYIHAPSLNQAVAAAVLRNGYISNSSSANRQTMAVNLTSERVRRATAMLEGIRGGQSLSALLGYQFERGLHDRHDLAEVDKFIFDLRREFPLRANRMNSTAPPEGTPIEAIEARNVLDGLALVNHIKTSGQNLYKFGRNALPDASGAEADAINAEVDRLLESHDAVADLALAEGIYQAVLGNYDRVASTYDAYSKGEFPPEPQVVRTPTNGIGLTHRVAVHLEAGRDPNASPVPLVAMTPRAQGEPAVNSWLAGVMPPLADIACMVSFFDTTQNPVAVNAQQVTLADLALQPADVLRLVRDDQDQAMTELDDRILRRVYDVHSPRPDQPVEIRYMETDTAPFSLFEVMPLLRQLRRLIETSRPLRSSDLTLSNEATGDQDASVFANDARVTLPLGTLTTLRGALDTFINTTQPLADDPVAHRADIINDADNLVADVAALLERAAAFSIPQTGWGFAFDFKRRLFRAVLEKTNGVAQHWAARLVDFDDLMIVYDNLSGNASEQDKLDVLRRAVLLITTAPLPALPTADQMKNELQTVTRSAFDAKRGDFADMQGTALTSATQLLAAANALLPISAFDVTELSFTSEEDEAIRFVEDAVRVLRVVLAEVDQKIAATQAAVAEFGVAGESATAAAALERAARALFGEEFLFVLEFNIPARQGDEIETALNASVSGTLMQHLQSIGEEFPVDTWLYGVARVREKLRAWEQVVMLAEAFGQAEPTLVPLQLPFVADDRWLALEFPDTLNPETNQPLYLDRDRLLYTAHFSKPLQKIEPQCGLLIDEWSEVIPTKEVETGIAFHYDRPNCEAPQAMLLVTPTAFRGAWQWADLIDALNETLDFAKRRAVEPVHVEQTAYARFLPATIMAVTMRQMTISAALAVNNNVVLSGG